MVTRDADHIFVDQHAHKFFHEEGVARSGPDDLSLRTRRYVRHVLEHLVDELLGLDARQRRQVDPNRPGVGSIPCPGTVCRVRTAEADDEDRTGCHVALDAAEQIRRCSIGPVQIFEQDHDRPLLGGAGKEAAEPSAPRSAN